MLTRIVPPLTRRSRRVSTDSQQSQGWLLDMEMLCSLPEGLADAEHKQQSPRELKKSFCNLVLRLYIRSSIHESPSTFEVETRPCRRSGRSPGLGRSGLPAGESRIARCPEGNTASRQPAGLDSSGRSSSGQLRVDQRAGLIYGGRGVTGRTLCWRRIRPLPIRRSRPPGEALST